MPNTWIYIVVIFAIVFVVMLIVGFIGNKVVDKTENALRTKRINGQKNRSYQEAQTESLAKKLNMTAAVPVTQTHKASFCANCGEQLKSESKFCPNCGAEVEKYRK